MRTVLLLALALLAAAPDAAMFYRHPEGTVWTYDADFAGNKRIVTYKVASIENERRHVQFDVFREGDPGATASDDMAWFEADGRVEWASEDTDGSLTPRWTLWTAGAKPGDSWKGPDDSQTTYVGDETVETPSGRHENAVHLRIRCDVTIDFWYAAGVGMVRMLRTDGETKDDLVLRKVERPE